MAKSKIEWTDETLNVLVSRWSGKINGPVRLLLSAGVGMAFVLATMCPAQNGQVEKHHSSHTVDQRQCHSEHRNDKLTHTAPSVRQCRSCGQHKKPSAFASKGRDRPSALCKDCDNKRRRSSYSPKITTPDWDNILVTVEPAAETAASDLTNVLLELLTEFTSIEGLKHESEVQGIDSVIMGRSSLDDLIGRV